MSEPVKNPTTPGYYWFMAPGWTIPVIVKLEGKNAFRFGTTATFSLEDLQLGEVYGPIRSPFGGFEGGQAA